MKEKKPLKKNKTLQLNSNINSHDVDTKVNNAKKWLDKGHRIKIVMKFNGRMKKLREAGLITFNNVLTSLIAYGAVINSPLKDEERTVTIILDSKLK